MYFASATKRAHRASYAAQQRMTGSFAEVRRHEQPAEHSISAAKPFDANVCSRLINSLDAIIWEANAKTFQFRFVSPQAERILGFPPELPTAVLFVIP
jgi:PAS domain-containing protein